MTIWFMRWLQGTLCEQSPLFDVDLFDAGPFDGDMFGVDVTAGARKARTPPTDRRDDASRARQCAPAFTYGGAII